MELEKAMKTVEAAVKYLSVDDFDSALRLLNEQDNSHWYCKVAINHINCRDFLTFEHEDIKGAMKHLKKSLSLVNSKRRKKPISSIVFSVDYNKYMEDEVFAELNYAELCLLIAGVGTQLEFSIAGLISSALYARKSYSTYQECVKILKGRTQWHSTQTRHDFECGVRMVVGMFDMGFSFLPSPLSTIMSFIGYSGNRDFALQQFTKAFACDSAGIRHAMSAQVIFIYNSVAIHILGLGTPDKKMMLEANMSIQQRYPGNIYEEMLSGILSLTFGDLDQAQISMAKMKEKTFQLKKLDIIFNFIRITSYILSRNFTEAEKLITEALDHKLSPAVTTYLKACLLHKVWEEETDVDKQWELRQQLCADFASVVAKKSKFAGQTYHEKYVLDNSRRFGNNPEMMMLPLYDAMCHSNAMAVFNLSPQHIRPILDDINIKMTQVEQNPFDSLYNDHKASLTFMQAHCLRHMAQRDESLALFHQLVKMEKKITKFTYIIPNTCYEISMLYHGMGDQRAECKKWLKKSLSYSGYSTELIVRYRATMALDFLKFRSRIFSIDEVTSKVILSPQDTNKMAASLLVSH